jgi:5-methylcytosine-specific restriction endonuclease McrA
MLRRRKKRSSWDEKYPGLGIAKGETRDAVKTRKHAHKVAVIAAVRAQVFERDEVCRCCGDERHAYFPDEMHELIPRSALRNKPPEDIFNLVNCVRLCNLCHTDVTEKRITVVFRADGAEGCLKFQWDDGGEYEENSKAS